jgi:arginine N-succinyltransferase
MLVIRPIAIEDLPALEALSHSAGFGLTSLPKDTKLLKRRIRASLRGFANLSDEDPPRGETYLFVLEDTETKKVVGTSGIVSKVGGFQPFYGYRLENSLHASAQLNVHKTIPTLHLIQEHDGPCEVGSLFLSPPYRHGGNGRLLSLSRFLFMAEHLEYFDPIVISELRGITDEAGRSPFWDAVGHHFFDIDFPSADYLSMVNKKFIADLMPEHPIYIPLLPFSAQAVIGKVQPETQPALALLQAEGFELTDMVDIFDAGPVLRCAVSKVRSIRDSIKATITALSPSPGTPGEGRGEGSSLQSSTFDVQRSTFELRRTSNVEHRTSNVEVNAPHPNPLPEYRERGQQQQLMLIANTQKDFRACMGSISETENGISLDPAVAAALNVKIGDSIRFVSAKPSPIKEGYDAPSAI